MFTFVLGFFFWFFLFLFFFFFCFGFFLFCQDLYEKLLCIVDTAFLLKIIFLSIYLSEGRDSGPTEGAPPADKGKGRADSGTTAASSSGM